MYRVLRAIQIAPEAQNCGQYLMKTVVKRENIEFLVITLKHVSGLAVLVNLPSNPKLWAIAKQNGHTTRKRQVFGRNSQTCIRSYGHYKYP